MQTFNKHNLLLPVYAAFTLTLAGCGSDSKSDEPVITSSAAQLSSVQSSSSSSAASSSSEQAATKVFTDLSTGSRQAPKTVYLDLDSGAVLDIDETQAQSNTEWDIAFNRTKVYLNRFSDPKTSLYYTGNADNFYDDSDAPINSQFLESDLDAIAAEFESYSADDLPDEAVFAEDSTKAAISGFYNYDFMTHVVTPAADNYFVVKHGDAYSKFNVTDITTSGRNVAKLSLSIAYQVSGGSTFDAAEVLDVSASGCVEDIYIDLDTKNTAGAGDDWELSIPCADGLASFEINLADTATAMSGESANIDGVDATSASYYTWLSNETIISAYKEFGPQGSGYGWGEYGLDGGHYLWPNFATYVINTGSGYYKFQITNYYSTDGNFTSGSYSVRFAPLAVE